MLWTVPRMWGGETVFILGAGPSLRSFDRSLLLGRRVMVINYAEIFPAADFLIATDANPALPSLPGRSVTLSTTTDGRWHRLWDTGPDGIETECPSCARGRRTSLQLALNVAVHLGCARAILLGADMATADDGATHWDGRADPRYADGAMVRDVYLPALASTVEPLAAIGLEVINATPGSMLPFWPVVPIGDVIA
ncbi:hypothetical protein J2847_005887 [Azospirillum agricola]|uniref:hypothetical protein n=1 Tax=Azospirillum agricola TaxID=1720247 RepID=UPI001AEB0F6D|nr:hypothetical protein [Azospirillum agricola]MBP2232558.1 hypothetical protein [Azospirillum agricola]